MPLLFTTPMFYQYVRGTRYNNMHIQASGHLGIAMVLIYKAVAADHAIEVNTVVVCIGFEEVYGTVHMPRTPTFMVPLTL